MKQALVVRRLYKRYRAGMPGCSASVEALRGVDLDVAPGEIVGLLGPNGAGKSTLLLCAAALLRPDVGHLAWFGVTEQRGQRPAGVAYVPERSIYYSFLSVREALDYYAALHHSDGAGTRGIAQVGPLLERLGLAEHAGKRIGQLSRGLLQRLGLAQALVGAPRLLLLDETLSGLDPVARRDVRELLVELAGEGVAVVLASHDLAALEQIAGRVVVLVRGRVRAALDPATLTRRRTLELTVTAPTLAATLLRTRVAEVREQGSVLRVPLDDLSADEVLARCRELQLVVHRTRVVTDDLEQRFLDVADRVPDRPRVAEERA